MTDAAGRAEFHSRRLRKELRLTDLIGMQILNIVGLFWVGTASKLGPAHVMCWVPAAFQIVRSPAASLKPAFAG